MRWFYALQGLGALSAFIFIVGSLGIFACLVVQDKPNAWLSLIPAIITSLARQKFYSKKYHKITKGQANLINAVIKKTKMANLAF